MKPCQRDRVNEQKIHHVALWSRAVRQYWKSEGSIVTKSPLLMITALATVLAVLVAINPFGRNLVSPHPAETATPRT